MQWADWLPDVLPRVPGCPDIVVEHELRRAAQDLLGGVDLWIAVTAVLPVAALQAEVPIVLVNPETAPARVNGAWLDGRQIYPMTPAAMAACPDDWQALTGRPRSYFMDAPEVLRLYPIPETAALAGLTARVRLQPSDSAAGLPDALARNLRQTIVTGALARLYLYKDKPWTDANLAVVAAQAFSAQRAAHSVRAARGNAQAPIPSTIRWC